MYNPAKDRLRLNLAIEAFRLKLKGSIFQVFSAWIQSYKTPFISARKGCGKRQGFPETVLRNWRVKCPAFSI